LTESPNGAKQASPGQRPGYPIPNRTHHLDFQDPQSQNPSWRNPFARSQSNPDTPTQKTGHGFRTKSKTFRIPNSSINWISHPVKTLFAVTFDNDEPPHLCVADNEDEARDLTLEHAADSEFSIRGDLMVQSEGTHPDLEDFERRYALRSNPYDPMAGLGGTLFGATGIEWDTVSHSPPGTVWTLLESDAIWWISPGFHVVNRIGYLLTTEERTAEESDYLYE
jgi:hypothetical protein